MFWYNMFFGPGPLPKNMSARKLARYETDNEWILTFATLLNLLCSIFKWEGFPDTVNVRALEASLIWRGCAAIAPYYGNYTNMGAGPSSGYNIHGEFTKFYGYGWNGYNQEYMNYLPGAEIIPELQKGAGADLGQNLQTGVLIRDNYNMFPMANVLIVYTKRLTDTMRRIDTVSYNLVWPGIIQVDDGQVNSARQMIQDHDDNLPVIIGRHALDQMGMTRIDLGARPETLSIMWEHYNRLYDRLMEIFGIEGNPTIGKAERVNTMETASNNMRTNLARDNRLHCREEAAERMNRLWGWNVSVSLDETIMQRVEETAAQLADAVDRTPGTGEGDDEDEV